MLVEVYLILNLVYGLAEECAVLGVKETFLPLTQAEGNSAQVRRLVGGSRLRALDPFLLFDHFFVDPPAGFPDHPHRGFETITYMIRGVCVHEDFHSNHGELYPGDVQWMTAGRGIVHAEMPRTSMEGIQIWLNLHSSQKSQQPHYQEYNSSTFPVFSSPELSVKILSGEYENLKSPIKVSTQAEFYDIEFKDFSTFAKTSETSNYENWNWIAYPMQGNVKINETKLKTTWAAVLNNEGNSVVIHGSPGSRVLLLGGQRLGEKVVQHGPFVMNSNEEIEKAFKDYRSGTNGFEANVGWRSSIYDGVK